MGVFQDLATLTSAAKDIFDPSALDVYMYKHEQDKKEDAVEDTYNGAYKELVELTSIDQTLSTNIASAENTIKGISAKADVLSEKDRTYEGTMSKVLKDNDLKNLQDLESAQSQIGKATDEKLEYYQDLMDYDANLKLGGQMAFMQSSPYFTSPADLSPEDYELATGELLAALEAGDKEGALKIRAKMEIAGWDLDRSGVVDREEYQVAINEIMKDMTEAKEDEAIEGGMEDPDQIIAYAERELSGVVEGFWDQVGAKDDLDKREVDMAKAITDLAVSRERLASQGIQDPSSKALAGSLKKSYGKFYDVITDDMVADDLATNPIFLGELYELHNKFEVYLSSEREGVAAPFRDDKLLNKDDTSGDPKGQSEMDFMWKKYLAGLEILNSAGIRHYVVDFKKGVFDKSEDVWKDQAGTGFFNLNEPAPGSDIDSPTDLFTSMTGEANIPGIKEHDPQAGENIFNQEMYNRIKNREIVTRDILETIPKFKKKLPSDWDDWGEDEKNRFIKTIDFRARMQLKEDFEWMVKNHFRLADMNQADKSKHDFIKKKLVEREYYTDRRSGESNALGHPFLDT